MTTATVGISGMFDSGAMPVLERVIRFTGERHRMLTHNIANLSTPRFQPVDVDTKAFQKALGDAMDRRARSADPINSPLPTVSGEGFELSADHATFTPTARQENAMFHDQNDRNINRIMADLAENTMVHNAAVDLMRNQFEMLNTAIRERL